MPIVLGYEEWSMWVLGFRGMGFVKKKETFNKKQQHFGVAFWVLGGGASIVK